jgi:hypothetical protein
MKRGSGSLFLQEQRVTTTEQNRMNRYMAATVAAVFTLTSCTDPTGVAESEGVRVEARSFGLVIQNRSDSGIHYFALDQESAARTTWVGCGWHPVTDPDQECGPGLRPGEKQDVAAAGIPGWGTSEKVVVYWWHLVPAPGGGFVQDSIRALVVSR